MIKAEITTPEAMAQAQIREDISRTPQERLDLAFRLSDLPWKFKKKGYHFSKEAFCYSVD